MKTITWTVAMRERLRAAQKAAHEAHEEAFTFDGNEFNTSYAKYLLEYLSEVLK